MKLTSFHTLFLHDLKYLYAMEQQIIKALPKVIEKVTTPELKKALQEHLGETKEQAKTVETLCKEFEIDLEEARCAGIEGILREGEETVRDNTPSLLLDLAIICNTQKVEHYEIAGYGAATNYAQKMSHQGAQDLLHKILQQKKASDEKLTAIAEEIIQEVISQRTQQSAMPS